MKDIWQETESREQMEGLYRNLERFVSLWDTHVQEEKVFMKDYFNMKKFI